MAAGPDPVPGPIPDPVPDPVGAAEFSRLIGRLGPFEPAPHLAVAVSGGRDSLALGLLAHDWAAGRNGHVTGLIVDHGLRSGSAGEAARTRETLGRSGIAAAVLEASGRPRKNLQAWARAARYVLMEDWCRDAGVLHLLVAHHRDDQAETLLAGLTRSTGLQGLAGMAAVRELPSCRIVRPLLGVPRGRLTATLEARNVAWIDDPSNRDRRFRRIRLRQRLAGGPEGPALSARAGAAGRARRRFERRVAHLLVASVSPDGPRALLDRAALRQAEPEIAAAAVAALIRWAGGVSAPPRMERLARTVGWLCGAARNGDRTIGGCAVCLEGARAIFAPEPGRSGEGARRGNGTDRPALAPAAFAPFPAVAPAGLDPTFPYLE
ncbi:MAG: tRNA lysidine(34) synthetase TilS [Rhodospirillaceae bacterium]|nr:tRNA lysidine(34) synthetase TilS [Rhodospirillaceae bacterium]